MDWRSAVGEKLVTPEEAVQVVRSGDHVNVAPFTCTPFTLCGRYTSAGRSSRTCGSTTRPGCSPGSRRTGTGRSAVHDNYATPFNRDMVNAGRMDYLPVARWREDEVPAGFDGDIDVFMVPVSPPDEHGYCSFGPGVWLSKQVSNKAKKIVAEVHESFIRTGGENFVHMSKIDRFARAGADGQPADPTPQRGGDVRHGSDLYAGRERAGARPRHDPDRRRDGVLQRWRCTWRTSTTWGCRRN